MCILTYFFICIILDNTRVCLSKVAIQRLLVLDILFL